MKVRTYAMYLVVAGDEHQQTSSVNIDADTVKLFASYSTAEKYVKRIGTSTVRKAFKFYVKDEDVFWDRQEYDVEDITQKLLRDAIK